MESIVLQIAPAGLGFDRGAISVAVDPAADRSIVANFSGREPAASALSRLGLVCCVSQFDHRAVEPAVRPPGG